MCEDCGEVFHMQELSDMVRFRVHRRQHWYDNFKCDCQVTWTNTEAKRDHVIRVHLGEKEGYVKCPVDGCEFIGKKLHLSLHTDSTHTEYTCEHCGIVIVGKIKLKNHTRISHPETLPEEERKNPLTMKGRNEEFRSPRNRLRPPRPTHTNFIITKIQMSSTKIGSGPVEPCPECGKQYERQMQLYSHYRQIHGTYVCSKCGAKVIGEAAMKKHNKHVHPKQKDLPTQCEQCGKQMANGKQLGYHILNVHSEESQRPFPCPHCPRRFCSQSRLWSHKKRAHTTDRPYACRYGCGSSYKEGSDRSGHEKKAHGMSFVQFQKQQQQESIDSAAQLGPQWRAVGAAAPAEVAPIGNQTKVI